jgi:branched-chain amino acid transport system substrate-binding protein
MKKPFYLALTLVVALVLATAASGERAFTPGITPTEVVIGGTIPMTGMASAYRTVGLGAAAYFRYVNAHGGVNNRKIRYVIEDDRSEPSQTRAKTRELVEQDHVFAIVSSVGTEQNLATRPYLNAAKVPQLFVMSGATTWGRDSRQWPWTIGYQPSYLAEGAIYGRYIARTSPRARVGVLYQNDDYGKELLAGLRNGLGKKRLIVSTQGCNADDPNVQAQIARLKAARTNTLMVFATPLPAIQSYVYARKLGWRPKVFMNTLSSASNVMSIAASPQVAGKRQVAGTISMVFLKDPSDPHWAKDRGVRLYRTIMRRFKGTNPKDVYNVYGMSAAHTFVEALKKAGKNPTRDSIMRAAAHLNVHNDPFLLPGVVVRTTRSDHFPIDQVRPERYQNGRWRSFGGLFRVR